MAPVLLVPFLLLSLVLASEAPDPPAGHLESPWGNNKGGLFSELFDGVLHSDLVADTGAFINALLPREEDDSSPGLLIPAEQDVKGSNLTQSLLQPQEGLSFTSFDGESEGAIPPSLMEKRQRYCLQSGWGICPGQNYCCPIGGQCCQGGGCCNAGTYCTTVNGRRGCCQNGRICTGNSGVCQTAGYVRCANYDFCCPSGSTCYRDSSGTGRCRSSTFTCNDAGYLPCREGLGGIARFCCPAGYTCVVVDGQGRCRSPTQTIRTTSTTTSSATTATTTTTVTTWRCNNPSYLRCGSEDFCCPAGYSCYRDEKGRGRCRAPTVTLTCRDAGYTLCPGEDFCCPSTATACYRDVNNDRRCRGTTTWRCFDEAAGYTRCPNEWFCCPAGTTCYRDSNNKGRCRYSSPPPSLAPVVVTTRSTTTTITRPTSTDFAGEEPEVPEFESPDLPGVGNSSSSSTSSNSFPTFSQPGANSPTPTFAASGVMMSYTSPPLWIFILTASFFVATMLDGFSLV